MPTFAPPVRADGVPPVLPEGDPTQTRQGWRLFRHYSARPEGRNVYLYWTDDTHTALHQPASQTEAETDPVTIYDANGNIAYNQWDRLAWVFWGGHAPVVIPSNVATILTNIGYVVT